MERRTYNTGSLLRSLEVFEREFGMSSDEFFARFRRDDPDLDVPGFQRHVWASFYREAREGDDGTLAEYVETSLQPA